MKIWTLIVCIMMAFLNISCGGSSGDGPDVLAYRMVPDAALYYGADYANMLLYVESDCDYAKNSNVALYQGADYAGMLLEVRQNMTAESCMDVCRADPECTFFYYNARGGLNLTPLTTQQNDCAFFRGQLWAGTANNTDTYVKRDPVEAAKQMCTDDPECTFFYYNERGGMSLPPLTTYQYEAAFFRGQLWVGSAGNSDTYIKTINGVDAWDL